MLDQIEAAMSLLDRIKAWRKKKMEPDTESVAARFFRLFEAHGVHRNQIPRFFGHGLTVNDVQSDHALLATLNEQVLEDACSRFAVRREWLDGAEKKIHPVHRFYKYPKDFASFISGLRNANPDGELGGVVVAPSEDASDATGLVILQERIGWIGDKPIYRHHLCDEWPFSYWKARGYLASCIAIAWRQGVYLHGRKAKGREINSLASGESLLGWEGEGCFGIGGQKWDPEFMALHPKEFLNGIDPEIQRFGIRSALRLWLELHQDGLMDTGLHMYEQNKIRDLFEIELEKVAETTALSE